MIDDDTVIAMRIVPFISKYRPAHKGWHRPEVEEGTKMYAIQYEIGGYFTYSYLDEDQAFRVMMNMRKTSTFRYYYHNVKKDIHSTIQVAVK